MSPVAVRGGTVLEGTWTGDDTADTVIDASGCWVMPVLTDAHCHLLPEHLRRLPLFGVGFAVDMFSTDDMRPRMDEEAADGGARYATAGVGAAVRGGHPYQLVASGLYRDFPSVAEAGGPAAFVRDRVRSGSALLKVFLDDGRSAGQHLETLTQDVLDDLVAEAHGHDLTVVAHAPTTDLALRAVEAGVDGLAHAPVPDGPRDTDEFCSAAAEHGIFVVTTLVATAAALGVPLLGSLPDSPMWERVPAGWRRHLTRAGRPEPDHAALDRLLALAGAAYDAGVKLLPGTDAAFPGVMPGASLHVELEILHGCGVPADQLMAAATSGMREQLHGTQERTELLVLGSDPRESVTATRDLRYVILGDLVLRFPGTR